ncbi:uncharacterized protein Dana_GF14767 [Drosophila ananassae]|uniref:Kinesin motor domain-containing protein n=3 Tax=Drosophila ananassae TaxID=7217 RepID=B3MMV3_DROAN|nr:uncharacterized protein Dana_GF14767 [Drosophila ananassae]
MAKKIVQFFVKGVSGTIYVYGQTSTGKRYTMEGDGSNVGLMKLAAKEIFQMIPEEKDRTFLLRVSHIEIYNDKIYDLLDKKKQDVKMQESGGILHMSCEECFISSENELLQVLRTGMRQRRMNGRPNRSHGIFRVLLESRKSDGTEDKAVKLSILNMVQLAGSEKGAQTGASGDECQVNKSLFHLKTVMKKVVDLQNHSSEELISKHISFRESKLTRILQASLTGHGLTSVICTIRPSVLTESQSTISFGLTARLIKTDSSGHEVAYKDTAMRRINSDIDDLKYQLNQEQRRNNHYKVAEIERSIERESTKIISTTSLTDKCHQKRRRTPCPSSPDRSNDTDSVAEKGGLSQPTSRIAKIQIPIPKLTRLPSRFNFAAPTFHSASPDVTPAPEEKAKVKTPTREQKDSKNDALLAEINALAVSNQSANVKIQRYEDQVKALKQTIAKLEMDRSEALGLSRRLQCREKDLLSQITDKDTTIERLQETLDQLSREVLNQSKEEQLRSLCPDLQACFERICRKCQELGHLLPAADAKGMEVIACECDKLRAEIFASRSKLESVQAQLRQANDEVTEKSDFCQKLSRSISSAQDEYGQLQSRYDDLEQKWKRQQEEIKALQGEYEKIQRKYQQLQVDYKKEKGSGKQRSELQAKNTQLLKEIETLKTRVEETQQQLDKSMNFETVAKDFKAENRNLKDQLANLNTEYDNLQKEFECLSTQLVDSVQENDSLQQMIKQQSTCSVELDIEDEEEFNVRREFAQLADVIFQIELHAESDFCCLFTSTKLKGSQNNNLMRLKLYLDSAKFTEDKEGGFGITSATVFNGLIKQHKFSLVRMSQKQLEEETGEEVHLLKMVSKLEKQILCKNELLADKTSQVNDLRKQIRTITKTLEEKRESGGGNTPSPDEVTTLKESLKELQTKLCHLQEQVESQLNQMLEKDKNIEKLKAEIEELTSNAQLIEQLEKVNTGLLDRATSAEKSLAELQRSINLLRIKEEQSSAKNEKQLSDLQEELKNTKLKLRMKIDKINALNQEHSQKLETNKSELEEAKEKHENELAALIEHLRLSENTVAEVTGAYTAELQELKDNLRKELGEAEKQSKETVSVHQEQLKEIKDLLSQKLQESHYKSLQVAELKERLHKAEAERDKQSARAIQENLSFEDMMRQRDSENARAVELERSKGDLAVALEQMTKEKYELHTLYTKSLDFVEQLQEQLGKDDERSNHKFEELQTKYQKQIHDMEKLMKEKIALQSKIEDAKADHSVTLERLYQLETEMEDLAAKKNVEKIGLDEKVETLGAKVTDLTQEMLKAQERAKDYDQLLCTHMELKTSLSNAKNLSTELERRVDHLKSQLNVAHEKVYKQNNEIEKLRRDLDIAVEERESALSKQEDLMMQVEEVEQRMSNQASEHKKQMADFHGSIEELPLKIESLNKQKQELEAVNEEMKLNLKASQHLQAQLEEERKVVADLQESYSNLKTKLKDMTREHAMSKVDINLEMERIKQNLRKVTEECDMLRTELETKEGCEAQLELERNLVIDLKSFRADLEKKLIIMSANEKKHNQLMADANEKCEQLRNEIEKFQQDKIQADLLISNLLKDKSEMEEKLAIQKDVDASKVELVAHLRAKELAELLERQKLESDLEEANDKCTELVQRIDAVSAECEQLRTLLKTKESLFRTEKGRLDATISSLVSDKRNLGESLCTLTDQIEKLEADLAAARCGFKVRGNTSPHSPSGSPPYATVPPHRHGLDRNSAIASRKLFNLDSEVRRNRRILAHDQNRMQSCRNNIQDSETMTDPIDMNLNGDVDHAPGQQNGNHPVKDESNIKYQETLRLCRYRAELLEEMEKKLREMKTNDTSKDWEISSLKATCENQEILMVSLQKKYEAAKTDLQTLKDEVANLRSNIAKLTGGPAAN